MPIAVRQMTPIVEPQTEEIHITSMSSPGKTACGKKCNGWKVAPVAPCSACEGKGKVNRRKCKPCNGEGWRLVGCQSCKEAIFFRVKPRGKR